MRGPLGRLCEPEDIANAAPFLVSRIALWSSGQVLTVSGGGTQELDWRRPAAGRRAVRDAAPHDAAAAPRHPVHRLFSRPL